jgi:hypothetical protein
MFELERIATKRSNAIRAISCAVSLICASHVGAQTTTYTETILPGSGFFASGSTQSVSFVNNTLLANIANDVVSNATLQFTLSSSNSSITSTNSSAGSTVYGNCYGGGNVSCSISSKNITQFNYFYSSQDTSKTYFSNAPSATLATYSDTGSWANSSSTNNSFTSFTYPANQNVYCSGGTCSNGWTSFYFYNNYAASNIPTTTTIYNYTQSFAGTSTQRSFVDLPTLTSLLDGSVQLQNQVTSGNVAVTSATLTFDVSPVPETESVAMLLAGLGLIVAAVRRRQK